MPGRRLPTLASLVDAAATSVADVGYDHGQLLMLLARDRPALRLVGVERLADAADRLRTSWVEALGPPPDHLVLHHGDGLGPLGPEALDTVVMAGIGERAIVAVLRADPGAAARIRRVVTCPATHRGHLRPAMDALGWRAAEERVAWDQGRAYVATAWERGREASADPLGRLFGPRLMEARAPELVVYLRFLERIFASALEAAPRWEVGTADPETEAFRALVRGIGPALRALGAEPG